MGMEAMAVLEEALEAPATPAIQAQVDMVALAGMAAEVLLVVVMAVHLPEGEVLGEAEQQVMAQVEARQPTEALVLGAWVDMAMQPGEQLGLV